MGGPEGQRVLELVLSWREHDFIFGIREEGLDLLWLWLCLLFT
jgi:hypothetical protein